MVFEPDAFLTTCCCFGGGRSKRSPKKVCQEAVTCSGTGGETISQGISELLRVVKSEKGIEPRKDGSLTVLLREGGKTSHRLRE
jgi:hypothetical protein